MKTLALEIPDALYERLERIAGATQQPLNIVVLRALQMGSPPDIEDVPPEFQDALAELDSLDDNTLLAIATARQALEEFGRYEELLANSSRTTAQQHELDELRFAADLLMLRKAHAAALLKWRGRGVPIAVDFEQLASASRL
ncbi:MAG: hypothetical protein WBA57_09795 [Elainellaceae cyanobacterium]